jgi:hypothetical protein
MKLATLSTVLVILITVTAAQCRTLYITPDGSGDMPDIKSGVSSASPGDTLLLADGIYTGRMNTDISYRGKAIVIKSESGNPQACIIDCQGGVTNWVRGFGFYLNEGPGSVLEGVTVQNGYMYEGGGIWCWDASPTISNVVLLSNVATSSGGAAYFGGSSAAAVTNVTACDNWAPEGSGICCRYGASPVILNSIVAFNNGGSGVFLDNMSGNMVLGCSDVYGNDGGDWIGPIMGQFGNAGNICLDPFFCYADNPEEPYTIKSTSPCVCGGAGCGLIGACGIGCWAGVQASIDIEPGVLNLRREAPWITCYIELTGGFDPWGIDIATVALNDSIFAEHHPTSVGDYDEDGIEDRMVKFSNPRVVASLDGFGEIALTVSGEVAGQLFVGVDTVRVIARKVKTAHHVEGGDLEGRPVIMVSGGASGEPVRVHLDLHHPTAIRVAVFDVRGRLVRELVDGVTGSSASSIEWDGRDQTLSKVGPGIYFISLEAGDRSATTKAVLVR